jgi:hypothetical protein
VGRFFASLGVVHEIELYNEPDTLTACLNTDTWSASPPPQVTRCCIQDSVRQHRPRTIGNLEGTSAPGSQGCHIVRPCSLGRDKAS